MTDPIFVENKTKQILGSLPVVTIPIFVTNDKDLLALQLDSIFRFLYHKSAIELYISSCVSLDEANSMVREWISREGDAYRGIEFDIYEDTHWDTDDHVPVHQKNLSLRKALDRNSDFYFYYPSRNFIRPSCLIDLIKLDTPIICPLLSTIYPGEPLTDLASLRSVDIATQAGSPFFSASSNLAEGFLVKADYIQYIEFKNDAEIVTPQARDINVLTDLRHVMGWVSFRKANDDATQAIEDCQAYISEDLNVLKDEIEFQMLSAPDVVRAGNVASLKTLIFCTAFTSNSKEWDGRYRRWVDAIKASSLHYDTLLMIDDGSEQLPNWKGLDIRNEFSTTPPGEFVLHSFSTHLGRHSVFDFPGWYRSFVYAAKFAKDYGFEKIIHIESDSVILGKRLQSYMNTFDSGWMAPWCSLYGDGFPESAIQVIAGASLQKYFDFEKKHPHESMIGYQYECIIPFDIVEKKFIGNRYGEFMSTVPANAEFAVSNRNNMPSNYYWWLENKERNLSQKSEMISQSGRFICDYKTGAPVILKILTHISYVGDYVGTSGRWIGVSDETKTIEGLSFIFAYGVPIEAIEYATVDVNGTVSDWHRNGEYSGTKGQSQSVKGFALRLVGADAAQFHVEYKCKFVGDSTPLTGANGSICKSPTGGGLSAILITISKPAN